MQDVIAFPTTNVADPYTGAVSSLPRSVAKVQLAQGQVVETLPSDPVAAEQFVADMRERAMTEAHQRGLISDIPPFEEYAAWCATRGFHALPMTTDRVTLYLLDRTAGGAAIHELKPALYSLERIHTLTNHPPRHFSKLALSNFNRALDIAKRKLGLSDLNELERQAPLKAMELYPDGAIPGWSEVG